MTATEILAEAGRRGLRVAIKDTEHISVSPRSALTEELRQLIISHRQEILVLLKRQAPTEKAARPAHDLASPWPTNLPGYGNKTLGPLTHCLLCPGSTWVRYGYLPVCLACVRKCPAPPDPKTRLLALLTTRFTINEKAWRQDCIDMIKDMIMHIFCDHPGAGDWFKDWRATHPEARLT